MLCTKAPIRVAIEEKLEMTKEKLIKIKIKFLFLNNCPIDFLKCNFSVSAPELFYLNNLKNKKIKK